MSQSNSLQSRHYPSHKVQTFVPTKQQIMHWIQSILPDFQNHSIQSLGNGYAYCRIINHYLPGTILPNRIIKHPSNDYQCSLNLKQVQIGLNKMKFNIPFDIQKICKLKFHQNWSLAIAIYRCFQAKDSKKTDVRDKSVKVPLAQNDKISNSALQFTKSRSNEKASKFDFIEKGEIFMVDRIKEILISNSNNTYKIKLIRKLLGEEEIKIQENEGSSIKQYGINQTGQQKLQFI